MRIRVKMNDLSPRQWAEVQALVKEKNPIPEGATHVCVIASQGVQADELHFNLTAIQFGHLVTNLVALGLMGTA